MKPVGIISGTIPLHEENIFQDLKESTVETRFGNARVFFSEAVVFIPRHGMDARNNTPPHGINHQANLAALQDMGVEEVIGINSTGSLKKHMEPGIIVIPDDYISLAEIPTIFDDQAVHIGFILITCKGLSRAGGRRAIDGPCHVKAVVHRYGRRLAAGPKAGIRAFLNTKGVIASVGVMGQDQMVAPVV